MTAVHNVAASVDLYRFRMAERLGCTVAELDERMSARELAAWIAYDRVIAAQQQQR